MNGYEEDWHELRHWNQVFVRRGVYVIFGHRGEGKSALAWWLAERFHQQGRRIVSFHTQQKARKLLPEWWSMWEMPRP